MAHKLYKPVSTLSGKYAGATQAVCRTGCTGCGSRRDGHHHLRAIEAFWGSALAVLRRRPRAGQRNEVWLCFGVWLLLGLEFELAADMIQMGQLATIAVIRTSLNYFLERDMALLLAVIDREREVRQLKAQLQQRRFSLATVVATLIFLFGFGVFISALLRQ
jgi:hypothetical protein